MSTSSVTPDQSSLASAVPTSAPNNYVEQSSQNPAPEQAATPPPTPAVGPRLASALSAIVGTTQPQTPPATPSPSSGGVASGPDDADFNTASGSGGWKGALGKGLSTLSTALSGIPAGARPSFAGGLGQGARAEQQAQANEQAVKFASFQDQVRAVNLHAQDLQKQAADDAQQQAQQAAEDFQNEELGKKGGSIDTHPNNGTAVMQTLASQTAANGAASITPGTHISADGENINVPANNPETLSAQVSNYKALEGKLPGLPGLPAFDPSSVKSMKDVTDARAALGQHIDIMQHILQGYDPSGRPLTHQELNDLIPAYQAQIDSLSKNGGATDYQLGTLKNTLAILQANEKNHSDAEDQANAKATANAAAKAGAVAGAQSQAKLPATIAAQNNAAANKAANAQANTNMFVGTDPSGNQIAGTSDQLKAAGAQGVTKLDADTGKKVVTARQLISPDGLFAQVKQDMLNLDAKGKMGSAATSRFNDALLSKAGSDPDYAPLFVHTHLLATALMQAHVGSRGSENMMDEFKSLANAGKMSAPTLRSALGAEYSYVKEKAMLPKTQPSQSSNGGGQ
jgi:hypothetical protein